MQVLASMVAGYNKHRGKKKQPLRQREHSMDHKHIQAQGQVMVMEALDAEQQKMTQRKVEKTSKMLVVVMQARDTEHLKMENG